MSARSRSAAVAVLVGLTGCAATGGPEFVVAGAAAADLAMFDFTDEGAWAIGVDDDGAPALELSGPSRYEPPFRSPLSLAVMRGAQFGDFDLTVRARQTGREYAHRDLVVVFAWRDPAHFVYAHLASKGDDNAHHVMLVDGAARRPVTTARTDGVAWGSEWHDLRVRRVGTHVEVWFDGGDPVLSATVPSWIGRVGLGSFDDTGRFRLLRVAAL